MATEYDYAVKSHVTMLLINATSAANAVTLGMDAEALTSALERTRDRITRALGALAVQREDQPRQALCVCEAAPRMDCPKHGVEAYARGRGLR